MHIPRGPARYFIRREWFMMKTYFNPKYLYFFQLGNVFEALLLLSHLMLFFYWIKVCACVCAGQYDVMDHVRGGGGVLFSRR